MDGFKFQVLYVNRIKIVLTILFFFINNKGSLLKIYFKEEELFYQEK